MSSEKEGDHGFMVRDFEASFYMLALSSSYTSLLKQGEPLGEAYASARCSA